MKRKQFLSIFLAAAFALIAIVPVFAAGSSYFPDVSSDAWYAEGVHWAADEGIVKGYPDGSFGVGRDCTWAEAVIMLWRAAGSKNIGDGSSDSDRAWAWLERQSGYYTGLAKGNTPISRIEFVWLLYAALGDLADMSCELPFTDVDFSASPDADSYDMALRWVFKKGIMQGYSGTLFCPDVILKREQVVTVLRRCFGGDMKYEITRKSVPLAPGSAESMGDLELVFLDGVTEIPYVEVGTVEEFLESICNMLSYVEYQKQEYELTVTKDGDRVVFMRENDFPMVLDYDSDTITFMDYDAFLRTTSDGNIIDVISTSGFDFDGNPSYFKILDSTSERYGRALTLDLGAYGLHLVCEGDEYYIPLQTVCDMLMTPLGLPIAYNGEGIFFGQPAGASAETYYSVPAGERSPALALFTYKELCFLMDTMYGLKDQHGIRSFAEEYQMIVGMQEALLSQDPAVADEALSRLTMFYLDDLHSGFNANSYLEGPDRKWTPKFGASVGNMLDSMTRVYLARNAAYPNGVPGYEEVDDTAFITFDSFTNDRSKDYYTTAPGKDETDTIGLMLYSFAQITRKGSPVKNVVMDLSNNGGGAAQAAAFVIGMFLGEGSISIRNTLTDALITENFRSDKNLDRVFDEKDTLDGYNLYCLTSPVSFSCGNLVPSVLKSSHKVTILGQTSGGGACCVMNASTADGAFFQFSGPYCISYIKNGSFYDVDQGVTPDVYIRDLANFYNRSALVDIIHSIK